ncbi:FHIPEP family type III secretion protein, partial [Escherichia coli]|nr:FHIPEP family type III secretion protein [Escherichia coli]
SIVTIVQFIVITKGSERVAEVAARFSLDGKNCVDGQRCREIHSILAYSY